MFHSRNGLFFQATGQGTVAIVATNDGKEPFSRSKPGSSEIETNIVCNVTLPENEWASVVCAVSASGETHERWETAREFHRFVDLTIPVHRRDEIAKCVAPFGGRMAGVYTDANPCEFYVGDDGGKHRDALIEALRAIGVDANYVGFTDIDYVYRPRLLKS